MKDYYRILEIEPSATVAEIKKAYRRLAHQYHPDKTAHDPYATARFGEIKEAYETLINPVKKEYYLQQRWYHQSMGKKKTTVALTPVSMLQEVLELDRYVSRLDVHRMDRNGLFEHLMTILDERNIQTINAFNEPEVNKEIVVFTLRISRLLSYTQIERLSDKWNKLTDDALLQQKIRSHVAHHRKSDAWEKYKPLMLLFIVVIICAIIFLLTMDIP